MYIEFRLPSGAGGMAAGYTKMGINKELKRVCEQYKIELKEQVTKAYRFRISFKTEQDYTLFALVWKPKSTYFNYTVWHEPIDTEPNPKRYYP
jgi:hypothetical protein